MNVTDKNIETALKVNGFTSYSIGEGKLMLTELMAKVSSNCYVSYTEKNFINEFNVLNCDKKISKKGSRFLLEMLYADSNRRPLIYELMTKHRR